MRITHIHLENLRSHLKTDFTLERITTLRGLNHSGKSSIEQAIEVTLARRAEVTGAGGQGQTDLLRFGEDFGHAELLLDWDGVPIEMRASLTRKSGLNVTIKHVSDKGWSPVEFARSLKEDQDILSCLCNNRFFIDLQPKDQKNLLASIILPSSYEWPENIKADAAGAVIRLPLDSSPFEVIESAYDAAFKARTGVNRAIKDWRPPASAEAYNGPTVDQIRARLRELQDERTQIAVKAQKLADAIRMAGQDKANHQRRAEEARTRIANEQKERDRIAEEAVSKTTLKKYTDEAANADRAKALDEAMFRRDGVIAQLKKKYDAVGQLDTMGQCPTCFQAITEQVIETLALPIKEEHDREYEAQNKDIEARKALGDPAGAQKKLDAAKRAEADLARIDRRIKDLEATVASAESDAAAIRPEQLPKPDSTDAELANLDDRIEKGTSALEAANRADALKADADRALAEKKKLDEEHARLERLLEYFGPKGIKAYLIAEHIGGFQNDMNTVLKVWGYEAELQIEPYGFQVRRVGSQYAAQLHMLSRSERLRFANAFSVALAMVSGWKFCVLDDTETIVGDDRGTLNRLVYESDLDQCILLAAEISDKAPKVPGTTFINLAEHLMSGISTTSVQVLASTPGK